ncbi:MAG: LptF/LptG family permease [Spirochaetales bacterium]|nr:LptF/LptG family permease [Spirochaetales bacterium]
MKSSLNVMREIARYKTIYMYTGREFVLSTGVSFLFFFFIFFLNQMLLMAERILSKRVPVWDVIMLIFYSLPGIIALALPFAALVGSLMTIGKFSSQNEIIAFQASGVSLRNIFIPIFALAVFFSFFSFVMNDYFLPLGTLRFNTLYRNLLYSHPELEIESYSIKDFQDSIIANGRVDGQRVETLFILDKEAQGAKRIIMAESAIIDKSVEGVISLAMKNVTTHSISADEQDQYSYSFAETMDYNLLLKNISAAFRNPSPREMSSYDVYVEIQQKKRNQTSREKESGLEIHLAELEYRQTYRSLTDRMYAGGITLEDAQKTLERLFSAVSALKQRTFEDRTLQIFLIEFHKKFALPFSCIVFIIFAFPVGLFTHKSGRSVGFGIGLFVSIFYWGMLVAGQTLGMRAQFPAFWAMWIPDIVILALGFAAGIIRVLK